MTSKPKSISLPTEMGRIIIFDSFFFIYNKKTINE